MSMKHEMPLPSDEAALPGARLITPAWTKWWLAVLTVSVVFSWIGFGFHLFGRGEPETMDPAAASVAAVSKPAAPLETRQLVEGPWGRLEITPITISPPLEFVWHSKYRDPPDVVWHFPNTNSAQLSELFSELGLPDGLRGTLRSLAEFDAAIDGYTIRPDRELVLGLRGEVRAKLYVALHGCKANGAQRDSFRSCATSVDQWFGDSPISPQIRQLVTPLIYRYGGFLFFSDLRSIESLLPSDQQRISLLKALTRESTLLLKLIVSPESDIDRLADYWGRGGRDKDVRPILESFSKAGPEQSLDVTRLLPPFAQQRLCTYPGMPATGTSIRRDCHWTALNFFSQQPDDRFGGNLKVVFDTFGKDYHQIFGNPQFGDLVVFIDELKQIIHSTVYIAADVVFTKNGTNTARPWMFLKLDDMDDFYPRSKPLKRAYFRRHGL